MPIDIHIKDFQIWEQADFTVDGLTVIVGPSNHGKSSIARATKGVLRNSIGEKQVRLTAPEAKVSATIEGTTIEAVRPAKDSTTYHITKDGVTEDYEKLNGAVPEPVEKLGLGLLDIGNVTLDPCFATQFSQQFVIQEGKTALNTIFGAFSSTEKLEKGKKEANKRIADKNSEAKLLGKQVHAHETLIAALTPLAAEAEAQEKELIRLHAAIQRKQKALKAAKELSAALRRRQELRAVLSNLIIPDVDGIANKIHALQAARSLSKALKTRELVRVTLKALVVPDIAPLETRLKALRAARALSSARATTITASAATASVRDAIATWQKIAALYPKLKAVRELAIALDARNNSHAREAGQELDGNLVKLRELSTKAERLLLALKAGRELAAAKRKADAAKAALGPVETALSEAQAKFDATQAQYHEVKIEAARKQATAEAATNVCPKCGDAIKKAGEKKKCLTNRSFQPKQNSLGSSKASRGISETSAASVKASPATSA